MTIRLKVTNGNPTIRLRKKPKQNDTAVHRRVSINMPKKSISKYEPQILLSRPQRNTKAKKVFDPSDNYIPKKRIKLPIKSEKLSASNNVKTPVVDSVVKKSIDTSNNVKKSTEISVLKKPVKNNVKSKSSVKSNIDSVNGFNNTLSPKIDVPLSNQTKNDNFDDNPVCTDILDTVKETCPYCKNDFKNDKDLVDCRICLRGVHRDCLLTEEPTWKFKLDHCIFLCQYCRQKRCSKCSQTEYNLETFVRCISCKVGLHVKCFNGYDIKPLHTIQSGSYLCIPCMTLATERIPEIEEDEEEMPESLCPSGPISISDDAESENDVRSIKSFDSSSCISFNYDENSNQSNKDIKDIPDIKNWDKERLFKYFLKHFPKEVAIRIIEEEIDGRGLLLFQRSDLPKLNLKLGPSMKFYKLVRILQTQSAKYPVFWE